MRDEAVDSLRALNEVVERLRAPGGCPWDREQTHGSLRPYLLEETYELLEAIESGEPVPLREELGDVLLQVLMHTAIAAEQPNGFDIGDVADTTRAKMIHRHPHVFADTAVSGAGEVVVNWERLKRSEKGERLSLLDGVPRGLPALALAQGVQKRPARIGFDETPTTEAAIAALRGAVDALAMALADQPQAKAGEDWTVTEGEIRRGPGSSDGGHAAPTSASPSSRLEEAVAEVLYAAVAVARRARVNPEDALRVRANAVADHFRRLEHDARDEGVDLHDLDDAEWQRRWSESAAPSV